MDEKGLPNSLHLPIWWYQLNLHLPKHVEWSQYCWLSSYILPIKRKKGNIHSMKL